MTEKLIHKNITEKILQSFFAINKTLPYGLSTDIYGNALTIEFGFNGLTAKRDFSIDLKYRNIKIGSLQVDFLVNDTVLVKVVRSDSISKCIVDDTKLLLKSSGYEVCMILNTLGENEYKRIIFSNEYKKGKS